MNTYATLLLFILQNLVEINEKMTKCVLLNPAKAARTCRARNTTPALHVRLKPSVQASTKAWTTLLLLVASSVGCGDSDKVYISGHVSLKDGTPVPATRVMFRSRGTGTSGTGVTNSEGYYELGSLAQGDGIQPGTYQVVLRANVPPEGGGSAPFHRKYQRPNDELEFTVEAGGAQTYDISLDPP